MKAPTASVLLLCMPLQSAGVGRSLLTAWTAPPLRHASSATFFSQKAVRRPASASASTSWAAAAAAAVTRARERGDVSAGAGTVNPLCSKSRGSSDLPAAAAAAAAAAATEPDGGAKKSLFIFGIGYVATAIALTYLRKGWTVHGTCTDPRKVKSLGDQGIKVGGFHSCCRALSMKRTLTQETTHDAGRPFVHLASCTCSAGTALFTSAPQQLLV